MKTIINFVRKEDDEIVKKLGGDKEDVKAYTFDEKGNETMHISGSLAEKLMQTVATAMVDTGKWTEEEAQSYLEYGCDKPELEEN